MELTYFGMAAIPVGIVLLVIAPQKLLTLSVFFIPFSDTSVVNITKTEVSASGLPPWMFFASLFMLSRVMRRRPAPGSGLKTSHWVDLPVGPMFIFLAAIFMSLAMPLLIDGRLLIQSPYFNELSWTPLHFTLTNVTATIYIIFGLIYWGILSSEMAKGEKFVSYLRLYCCSALFVCLWGILQFGLYHAGLEYPAMIFNSSVSPGAELFDSELTDLGVRRISSVSVEPSMLAEYLLTVLPFLVFRFVARKPLISRAADYFVAGSIIAVLILSTSATAYLGLVILLILSTFWFVRLGLVRSRHVFFVIGTAAVVCIVLSLSSVAHDLVVADVFGKLTTGSGLERSLTISLAWHYFTEYPLLGIGWGSAVSHDLAVKLLSNTGICGFCAFAILIITIARGLGKGIRDCRGHSSTGEHLVDAVAAFVALIIMIGLNAVTEFAYVFGHLWFVFAICTAITSRCRLDKSEPVHGLQTLKHVGLSVAQ